jgi:exosortase/archaeosortase family protein
MGNEHFRFNLTFGKGIMDGEPMQQTKTNKWRAFFTDEANLFVIKIILIYAGWKAAFAFVLHGNTPLAAPWERFVNFLGYEYAGVTSAILNVFGEHSVHWNTAIYFPSTNKAVYVVEHCLAIPATLIFVSAILMYRGSWKNKLWFIPMGILAICVINLIRLVLLSITFQHFTYRFYQINHSIVYVVITYALIMGLIIWWMRKFGTDVENRKG